MHLADGTAWTIPVTLSLSDAEAKRIGGADRVALHAAQQGRAGAHGRRPWLTIAEPASSARA